MPDPISTAVFPGDDISPEGIGTAASMIRYVGDDVASHSADVVTTWSTLADSYTAPESGSLLSAMDPLKTSGTTFDTNVTSAAVALETFAEEVRAIKKTLEGIRGDANTFLSTIHDGKVTATVYGNNEGQTRTEEKAWNDDPVTASKNNELLGQVAAQAALLAAAEQKCANAILAILDPVGRRGENGGSGLRVGPAPAVENPPWGTPVEFPELMDDPVGRGLKKVLAETVQGVASLAGFDTSHYHYDLDDTRGSDNLAQIFTHGWSPVNSWNTLVGINKVATGLNPLAPALALIPGWYGQQFRDGQDATRDFLKSQVAWDDWKKHPGEAATQTVVNLATVVLAVAKVGTVGKAGAAGRAGTEASEAAAASKAAEAAAAARRLSEVGERVGTKVTMPTLDTVKTLARAPADLYHSIVDKLHVKVDVPDHSVKLESPDHLAHELPKAREPEVSHVGHAKDHVGSEPVPARTHGGSAPGAGTDLAERPRQPGGRDENTSPDVGSGEGTGSGPADPHDATPTPGGGKPPHPASVPDTPRDDVARPAHLQPQPGDTDGGVGRWEEQNRGTSGRGLADQVYASGVDLPVSGHPLEYVVDNGRGGKVTFDGHQHRGPQEVFQEIKGNYDYVYKKFPPGVPVADKVDRLVQEWTEQAARQQEVLPAGADHEFVLTRNPELVPLLEQSFARAGIFADVVYLPFSS